MNTDKSNTILVVSVIISLMLLSATIITYMNLRKANQDISTLETHTWSAVPHYAINGTHKVLGISILDEQSSMYLAEIWIHYKTVTVNGTATDQYLEVYPSFSYVPYWFTYNYTLVDEDLTRATYNVTQLETWLKNPDLVKSDNMQSVDWGN